MKPCEYCDRPFETDHGLNTHVGMVHADEAPWNDGERLRELYKDEEKSPREIADEMGTGETTIRNSLGDNGINLRPSTKEKVPHYRISDYGYETWVTNVEGTTHTVLVHRLAAVAWYGPDAIDGKHVHHKSEIPWLNLDVTDWPEIGIVPVDPSEHVSGHMKARVPYMIFDEAGKIAGWER